MNRADLLALLDEARRAPSVHNTQPARWRDAGHHKLELCSDPTRWLKIADPKRHDERLSLGAAYEGMSIALARRGYWVSPPELLAEDEGVARLTFEGGGEPDPLGFAVARRAAYRGLFVPARTEPLDELEAALEPHGVTMVRARDQIRALAKLADRASEEFLLTPGYWRETWEWLRLDPSHPGWARDGLNAESLALSPVELKLGRLLMPPGPFEIMRRLGLAGLLLSERAKVESAAALLLFTARESEDPFETGRAFYRRWLEVTAAGLALCPMSSLADSARANREIRELFAIPEDRRLVNVFRIGVTPGGYVTKLTPRLPAEELLVV
jgi:nitroreductase